MELNYQIQRVESDDITLTDITKDIAPIVKRIENIQTDNNRADGLRITIDDLLFYDPTQLGDAVEFTIINDAGSKKRVGRYYYIGNTLQGNPKQMVLNFSSVLNDKSYLLDSAVFWAEKENKDITLDEVLQNIGMTYEIEDQFKDLTVNTSEFYNITPRLLLTQLAEANNAVVVVKNKQKLYFVSRDFVDKQVVKPETITMNKADIKSYYVNNTLTNNYTAVRVRYWDKKASIYKNLYVGEYENLGAVYILNLPLIPEAKTEEFARKIGEAKLAELKRDRSRLVLETTNGLIHIEAMMRLVVNGIRKQVDGNWVIGKVSQSFDVGTGFTTRLECYSDEKTYLGK